MKNASFYQEVSFILDPFRLNSSMSHFVVVVVFLIVHVPKTNIKSVEQISNVITTIETKEKKFLELHN